MLLTTGSRYRCRFVNMTGNEDFAAISAKAPVPTSACATRKEQRSPEGAHHGAGRLSHPGDERRSLFKSGSGSRCPEGDNQINAGVERNRDEPKDDELCGDVRGWNHKLRDESEKESGCLRDR